MRQGDPCFLLAPAPPGYHDLDIGRMQGLGARSGATRRSWSDRLTRRFEARAITATERKVLRRARATITVSDLDREGALALAPGANVVTVPVSVDLAHLRLLPPRPVPVPPRVDAPEAVSA